MELFKDCSNVFYKSLLQYRKLYSSKGDPESSQSFNLIGILEYRNEYSSIGVPESKGFSNSLAYSSIAMHTRVKDFQREINISKGLCILE